MSAANLVAIVSLSVTLLGAILGMLAYMYRVGALVATLTAAIADMRRWEEHIEKIPLIAQGLETVREIVDEHSRRMSDFPRMRERLDSITEDVKDAELPKMQARLAVVEKLTSSRAMPAVRMPREEPSK
jgi:hypothetical protein